MLEVVTLIGINFNPMKRNIDIPVVEPARGRAPARPPMERRLSQLAPPSRRRKSYGFSASQKRQEYDMITAHAIVKVKVCAL